MDYLMDMSWRLNFNLLSAHVQHSDQQFLTYYLINYTLSQKFPHLNSLQLCQILTDFQKICTAGKHMKFGTKPYDSKAITLGMLLHYFFDK